MHGRSFGLMALAFVLGPVASCLAAPGGDPLAGKTAFAACQGRVN